MFQDSLALDLVLFDFESAHAENPEQALADLQLLLSDRDSCLRRVTWLRKASSLLPESKRRPPAVAYSALVTQPERLFDVQATKLTLDQVEELHRLCGDPDALWRAHQTLTQAEKPLPIPAPPGAPLPTTDWTITARNPGTIQQVKDNLMKYAPHWLEECGLNRSLAADFVAYAGSQLPIPEGSRFRDAWPVWLVTFARQHGKVVAVDELTGRVSRVALLFVLEQQSKRPVPWLQKLMDYLRQQLPPTAETLDGIKPPAEEEVGTDTETIREALWTLGYEIKDQQMQAKQAHDLMAA
jgi:hypothetical protein